MDAAIHQVLGHRFVCGKYAGEPESLEANPTTPTSCPMYAYVVLQIADQLQSLRLRESRRAPGGLGEDPDVDFILGLSSDGRLLCAACGEPVTAEEHRIDIEGRHVHRRTNPAGFEFELGCFREAPGAVAAGEATMEHTWFAGWAWRLSICRGCGFHLGCLFESGGSSFLGLILDRLETESRSRE